ncbi:MAG: peptidoglycan binding protein CsiV, partial [Gammaproteobacteria bacterium]|nr:peptidoglycan binding protein CsiV [Gammaproteobacteria bacterium]
AALSGKVRIRLSRYLHADFDIQLQNPNWSPSFTNEPAMLEPQAAKTIHFNVSRKLKRDKIHYIDHPLAGILLRIERFEKDQDLPESEEPDSQTSKPANQKSTT